MGQEKKKENDRGKSGRKRIFTLERKRTDERESLSKRFPPAADNATSSYVVSKISRSDVRKRSNERDPRAREIPVRQTGKTENGRQKLARVADSADELSILDRSGA